jgi:hypothetical protein
MLVTQLIENCVLPFPPQRKRAADNDQNAQRVSSKKTKPNTTPVADDEVSAPFVYAFCDCLWSCDRRPVDCALGGGGARVDPWVQVLRCKSDFVPYH